MKVLLHESYSAGMGVDEAIRRGNAVGRKLKDSRSQRAVEFIEAEFGVDLSEREESTHSTNGGGS